MSAVYDEWKQSNDGDSNQQVQAQGDVSGPVVGPGGSFDGVHVGGSNSGTITITTFAAPGNPQQKISIKEARRFPAPTSVIGVVSGLITITGATTGVFSFNDLLAVWQAGELNLLDAAAPSAYWWLLASVLVVVVGIQGFRFVAFLRRHVLWLPRWSALRARAGLRTANGRTYPYSLRLAARCADCGSTMKFRRMPTKWVDHYQGATHTARTVTERPPVAQCKRDPRHWVEVDIARNDFDKPLER